MQKRALTTATTRGAANTKTKRALKKKKKTKEMKTKTKKCLLAVPPCCY
jgi:hypothetical protein